VDSAGTGEREQDALVLTSRLDWLIGYLGARDDEFTAAALAAAREIRALAGASGPREDGELERLRREVDVFRSEQAEALRATRALAQETKRLAHEHTWHTSFNVRTCSGCGATEPVDREPADWLATWATDGSHTIPNRADRQEFAARRARLRAIVDEQADDPALWPVYPAGRQSVVEAYLQQELRRLHAAVEET
jgi:hypothetical protein